jgi:predicted ArsR family transcriptional regulator
MSAPASRLDLLKALGDNTRYAIYLELARSPRPLSTSKVADSLGLHVNTVRPHLERMREVGLLTVRPDTRGAVGRPQKLFSLAADSPSLGLEPPVYPLLSRMLLDVAIEAGAERDVVLDAGRNAGRTLAHRPHQSGSSLRAAVAMQEELGFDPVSVPDEEDGLSVGFGHCPFAELAEDHPHIVCSLHQGILEGFLSELDEARVVDFHDISSRTPCLAVLSA